MKKNTSIIIVTYNNLNYTKECIESIYKYTEKDSYEIIVVDNHSTDETRKWLKDQKNLKVIFNEENLGFPKACNQAIEIAEKDNDILLLNNDTIVTTNWLKNLKICLYSDDKIGATGAVCNHNENEQGCNIIYDNFQKMQDLAKENNQSNPSKWEEKTFLIGFCLLIKREVMQKIKYLDEEYSPGYVEDNDLSLKILEAGYKLMLCHDCFIHHYLGTEFRKDIHKLYQILDKNRLYFYKKWGFSAFCFDDIKQGTLKVLGSPKKILEFDCGIGATILKLKYQDSNRIIHGIEKDISKVKIAKHFTKIYSTLDEVKDFDYDCILIGNLLENVYNPRYFLKQIKKYLKDGASIIGEIENAASFKNIMGLVKDHWYKNQDSKIYRYTFTDLQELLEEEGYKIEFVFSWYDRYREEDKKIIEKLKQIQDKNYDVVSYTVRFHLNDHKVEEN